MKIVFVVIGALVALVGVVCVFGALLPARHTASRDIWLPVPKEEVFSLVTNVTAYSQWRSNVRNVEVLAEQPLRFREKARGGDILYEEVERRAPEKFVVRIADPSLPFGGRWTYLLQTENEGTRLSITEDGIVRNIVFRFMSRFVFGHTATMDAYLKAVRDHFASDQEP